MCRISKVKGICLTKLEHISKEEMNNGQSAVPNKMQLGNIRKHIIATSQQQQARHLPSCTSCIAFISVTDCGLCAAIGNGLAVFAVAILCVGRRYRNFKRSLEIVIDPFCLQTPVAEQYLVWFQFMVNARASQNEIEPVKKKKKHTSLRWL